MSIETWAAKVVAAVLVAPDERAPVDAVLMDFLDEYEALALKTRLKVPAFARALAAAGLTLNSGAPYSANTLRTQINRARLKRSSVRGAANPGTIPTDDLLKEATLPKKPPATSHSKAAKVSIPMENDGARSVLKKLEGSKPKRVESLLQDER